MDSIRKGARCDGRAGGAAPAIIAGIVLVAAILVGLSLRRPPLDTYPPTPARPAEVGARLVGPLLHTVDASSPDAWRFFSFSLGSVVENPGPLAWDLAFRRFQIIANGGDGFAGSGGILDLGKRAFADVRFLPEDGYVGTTARSDSTNAAIARWYSYSWTSHVLSPEPRVFAVRTADGRYAKLEIASYYCPGAQPGCTTFRYVYQGAGGRDLSGGEAGSGNGHPERSGDGRGDIGPESRKESGEESDEGAREASSGPPGGAPGGVADAAGGRRPWS